MSFVGRALISSGLLAISLIATLQTSPDWLVYNGSPSVPRGFYRRVSGLPDRGAFVTVRARDVAESYAASRSFTQARDRFIKRVAASEGDEVCAQGARVEVSGDVFIRLAHDPVGQALPSWSGCRVLRRDEFFLLGDTVDSFDSRYFGVVTIDQIEGVWRPL